MAGLMGGKFRKIPTYIYHWPTEGTIPYLTFLNDKDLLCDTYRSNMHVFIIFVQQKKYIKHQPTDILTWLKLKPATPVILSPASPPISRKPCLDSMCKGQTIRLTRGQIIMRFIFCGWKWREQPTGAFDHFWFLMVVLFHDHWWFLVLMSHDFGGKGTESRHVIFGDFSVVVGMASHPLMLRSFSNFKESNTKKWQLLLL